jgi:hypothetical protein
MDGAWDRRELELEMRKLIDPASADTGQIVK